MKRIVIVGCLSLAFMAGCGAGSPTSMAPIPTLNPKATGLPTDENVAKIVAALPQGNADRGKTLFITQACRTCHSLDKREVLAGPTFQNIFTTSATREKGLNAKEYIYESVVNPNKYVVDGYQPYLMTQEFAKTISPQDMADLMAWIERDLK